MRSERASREPRRVCASALAAALVLAAVPGRAEVRERVLAAVDRRPILLSEVLAVEIVRGLPREEALKATIDEHLMFREASRLAAAASAISAEHEDLRALLLAHPGLVERVGQGELRRFVRRQAVILKYVELRFLPQVRIGDDVVREAYAAETAGRSGAPAFEAVAEQVRERLTRRDLDARIEGWVKELRAGADIRYNP